MNITTLMFLLFVGAGLLFYYRIPGRMQWGCLLAMSAVFVCAADWRNLFFIALEALIVRQAGLGIARAYRPEARRAVCGRAAAPHHAGAEQTAERQETHGAGADGRVQSPAAGKGDAARAKRILFAALALQIGLLFLVKYLPAAVHLDRNALNRHLAQHWLLIRWITPIGMSYYTLMAVSYVLDVYWKRMEAERSFLRLCLFLGYFPLLVQGPVSRYSQLKEEFFRRHSFSGKNIKFGVQLMLWGYFKKLVIADRIGVYVGRAFRGTPYGLNIWIGLIFYGIQLYCDFSGGIDVVRGVSECFDVKLIENFRQPYFSLSLGEFWRRWHISLGAFMKDYVFFPLALWKPLKRLKRFLTKHQVSRRTAGQIVAAVGDLIVFLIVGIWHGAGSKYTGWGLYNGIILAFSAVMEAAYARQKAALRIDEKSKGWRNFCLIRTLIIVTFGWLFDCADTAGEAGVLFLHMWQFSKTNLAVLEPDVWDGLLYGVILTLSCLLLLKVDVLHEKGVSLREKYDRCGYFRQVLVWSLLFQAILLCGRTVGAGGFMYEGF